MTSLAALPLAPATSANTTGCNIFSRGEEESQGLLVLRVLVCKEHPLLESGSSSPQNVSFCAEKKCHWLGAVYGQLARELLATG